jgi:hypothetical protein
MSNEFYQEYSYAMSDESFEKHLHHPDLPVASSEWSEAQTLHVAAVFSNPFRWKNRREIANDFKRHMMQLPNIKLHFVELAYGDRPFEVTHRGETQLRTKSELFHKENLANLAVRSFPPDWQYGALIDADFHFTRHDIGLETIHQLQHSPWVQMFSSYINLSGEAELGHGHRPIGQLSNGFAYSFVQGGCRLPDGYHGGWAEPASGGGPTSGALPWIGAPGGAWAFTREGFEAVGGFMDKCPLGSADWFMAFGLAGHTNLLDVEKLRGKKAHLYAPEYLAYVEAWQKQAALNLRGNIGYVDSFALHHYHGPLLKRGYSTRDDILIENNYSPVTDVSYDWQGVLQLTAHKPKLRDAIRLYFLSRNEDQPHIREGK